MSRHAAYFENHEDTMCPKGRRSGAIVRSWEYEPLRLADVTCMECLMEIGEIGRQCSRQIEQINTAKPLTTGIIRSQYEES